MKAVRELTLYSNLAIRLYSLHWPPTESNGCDDWHVIAAKMCRLADSQRYDGVRSLVRVLSRHL
jgi:hypothetical protein